MEDIRQYVEQALEEIRDAIDAGDISKEEVEQAFLDMLS
jgi:hypothetical protein